MSPWHIAAGSHLELRLGPAASILRLPSLCQSACACACECISSGCPRGALQAGHRYRPGVKKVGVVGGDTSSPAGGVPLSRPQLPPLQPSGPPDERIDPEGHTQPTHPVPSLPPFAMSAMTGAPPGLHLHSPKPPAPCPDRKYTTPCRFPTCLRSNHRALQRFEPTPRTRPLHNQTLSPAPVPALPLGIARLIWRRGALSVIHRFTPWFICRPYHADAANSSPHLLGRAQLQR